MRWRGTFVERRIVEPVRAQLLLGITPRELALAVALGVVVSVMPLIGVTAIVAAALGALLRLNLPVVLAANYAAYPLQIALFIPFFQAGAWVTGNPPVAFSLEQIRRELEGGIGPTLVRYGGANLRALLAWALVAVPLTLLLAAVLRPLLARLPLPRDRDPAGPPPARKGGV